MAQGSESSQQIGKMTSQSWDNTSRKSGFQAMQSKSQQQDKTEKKNPWGPVFKDKKHFANLHTC